MDFTFSDDQDALRESVRAFLSDRGMSYVREMVDDERGFTDEVWSAMTELGWPGLLVPESDGGLGLDLISASYVGEQIAINPSFGGSLGAHTSIGTLPLVYFGTEEQKARYLPRLASGALIGAAVLIP